MDFNINFLVCIQQTMKQFLFQPVYHVHVVSAGKMRNAEFAHTFSVFYPLLIPHFHILPAATHVSRTSITTIMTHAVNFIQLYSHCHSRWYFTRRRYLAICFPLGHRVTHRVARIIIAAIWCSACILLSPWAAYYEQHIYVETHLQTVYVCGQFGWPNQQVMRGYFLGVIVVSCYTLPLVFVTVCYTLIGCRVWHRNAKEIANASQVRRPSPGTDIVVQWRVGMTAIISRNATPSVLEVYS